jgi:hypothetical protein
MWNLRTVILRIDIIDELAATRWRMLVILRTVDARRSAIKGGHRPTHAFVRSRYPRGFCARFGGALADLLSLDVKAFFACPFFSPNSLSCAQRHNRPRLMRSRCPS